METLLDELQSLLAQGERLVTQDGSILKNLVVELGLKLDTDLLHLLLSGKRVRDHFFVEVDGVLVFDKVKFLQFVNNKQFLPDSYTTFKNKIGLSDDGGETILSHRGDVTLVWPYKDCVLEGGQMKEDVKRNEVFWNTTLAPDQIDRLLDPKILTNFRRVDADGEHPAGDLQPADNFVLKGNNLVALHSLLPRFRDQVRLIYIDPPYNTGSDSFGYNDRFNHSTWLTFLKNRLTVARELLRADGSMWVQIDHHELAYLNVMLDEIFGRENMIRVVSIKTSSPAGFKTINPGPVEVTEYLLWYARDRSQFHFKDGYTPVSYDSNYNLYIENFDDDPEAWKLTSLIGKFYEQQGIKDNAEAKELWGEKWKFVRDLLIGEFAVENAHRVVSKRDPHRPTDKRRRQLRKSREYDGVLVVEREEYDPLYLYEGGSLAFYSSKVRIVDGELTPTELLTDFWDDISWAGIANEGGVTLKAGKKPERLLKRIIDLSTDGPDDVVLDFFLGTGTTTAVAHKMGRQYIGIEQLDYGENDAVVRLKNVIGGDSTGISDEAEWQAGGEFVVCELMELNERYLREVEAATSTDELGALWQQMQEQAFLSYRVDLTTVNENAERFDALTLHEQKRFLLETLDHNALYVNFSEIEDADYDVGNEDRRLNRQFYGGEA